MKVRQSCRRTTALLIAALSLSGLSANAGDIHVFDASLGTLPEAQGFIFHETPGGAAPFVAGGVMHIPGNPVLGGYQFWYATNSHFDFATNTYTLETTLQVLRAEDLSVDTNTHGFQFEAIDSAGYQFIVSIGTNSVALGGGNCEYTNVVFNAADGFHTYRVLFGNGTVALFIDNTHVASSSIIGGPVHADKYAHRVYFGDGSGWATSDVLLRRFSFTCECPAIPLAGITSTFDTDADGWMVISNGTSGIQYSASGHPGGCVRYTDDFAGPARFEAPAKFLGDRSAYYGGLIRWDAFSETSGSWFSDPVILIGGKITNLWLFYTPPDLGGLSWTTRRVPLVACGGWLVGPPHSAIGNTNTPATESQLRDVLSGLEHMRLPTDYVDGTDSARIDNIVLLTAGEAGVPALTVRLVGNSDVEVCWLSQSCHDYQLQYRSLLTTNLWTNLGGIVQGSGTRHCYSEPVHQSPHRFYRIEVLERP